MSSRATLLAGISTRIADKEARLSSAALDGCLTQALTEYSQRRPQTVVAEVVGSDTAFLSLPATWQTGFSEMLNVASVDDAGNPSEYSSDEWQVIQNPSPDPELLYFFGEDTDADVTYRLTFTIAQTSGATSSTLPVGDEPALMDLAASIACILLAAEYLQSENPAFGTVQIDYKSKASEYRVQAKEYRDRYQAFIGQAVTGGASTNVPAGRFKSWRRYDG
jgi:hypothetical protein